MSHSTIFSAEISKCSWLCHKQGFSISNFGTSCFSSLFAYFLQIARGSISHGCHIARERNQHGCSRQMQSHAVRSQRFCILREGAFSFLFYHLVPLLPPLLVLLLFLFFFIFFLFLLLLFFLLFIFF